MMNLAPKNCAACRFAEGKEYRTMQRGYVWCLLRGTLMPKEHRCEAGIKKDKEE